jgi:hypothetical protein
LDDENIPSVPPRKGDACIKTRNKSRGTGRHRKTARIKATAGTVEEKADTTVNAPEWEDLRAGTPGPDTARR